MKDLESPEPGDTELEPPISKHDTLPAVRGASNASKGLALATFAGLGWLLAQNVGARVIGFGSQIVLARILVPADFASLALAGTVTAIFGALVDFGVGDVLLQRQKAMRFWATPALLASLGLGLGCMLLVIAAAPVAAHLYRAPILLSVLPIMAIGMPLGALSTVPEVRLRAALNFRFLATYATVELLVTQVATVILALNGFGAFSFVLPGPIAMAVRAAVFWTVAKPQLGPIRPRQLRMIGSASSPVFGSKVITAIVGQGDYFVLGLFAAKPVVGAYFFAFRLAIQPVQMLAGNLSTVLFPALAQLQNDPVRQREAALNASRVLAFVVMPYCFMQAAVARPLLSLVFGAKWEAAIPLVQILSIGLAFDAVSWIAGALLSARGEFRRAFIYSCAFSPPFFVAVAIGASIASATGVAAAVSLFYIILAPCYSYAVFRRIGVSFREVAAIYLASTVFAAIAMASAAGLANWISTGRLIQVAVIVALGGGLYLGLVRVFTPRTFRQIGGRLTELIQSKRKVQRA